MHVRNFQPEFKWCFTFLVSYDDGIIHDFSHQLYSLRIFELDRPGSFVLDTHVDCFTMNLHEKEPFSRRRNAGRLNINVSIHHRLIRLHGYGFPVS